MTKAVKLSQFSLLEEIKRKYRDLDVITSRKEYWQTDKEIFELEKQLATLKEKNE